MAKNDITGDIIKTKASSQAYRDGWDLIFNKKNMKKLILATATWCGPCVMMKSKLDKEKILDKVEIIDADEDVEQFKKFNIRSVPQLIVVNGEEFETFQGSEDIIAQIKANGN